MTRNLPAAPLVALIRQRHHLAGREPRGRSGRQRPEGIESYVGGLGVSGRSWWRWQAGGGVDAAAADRVCATLGVHPVEVWGDDWATPCCLDDPPCRACQREAVA